MALSGFSDIRSLPPVSVNGAVITFDGHHAVSTRVFRSEFKSLFDALASYGFDGRNFALNGVPLPNTIAGATSTGMAAHIDGHPEFVRWQLDLFGDLNSKFRDSNFGALTREQWLQPVARSP